MNIEKYFETVKNKKIDMEKAYKEYMESIYLFCDVTGMNVKDVMVSKSRVIRGLDDFLKEMESKSESYKKALKDFKAERNKCLLDINKLSKPIYKLIIEYYYINEESEKELSNSLKKYHNKFYSTSHVKRLLGFAKQEFEKMILNDTK